MFAQHESHVLCKRAGAQPSFQQLCAALAQVGDMACNRPSQQRHPQDASGKKKQFGDGFALVDRDGVGLFVRVRETGEDDGPNYTYFHATSVGLAQLVLAADLALLHDMTLEPIKTLETLTIQIQANLSQAEMDGLHACITREFGHIGYTSQR